MADDRSRGRRARRNTFALLFALVLALLATAPAPCQDQSPPPSLQGDPVDADRIDALRKSIEADAALGDDLRKQALAMLDEARSHLSRRDEWSARRTALQATLDAADAEIARIHHDIDFPSVEPTGAFDIGTRLADLEAAQSKAEQDRRTAAEELAKATQAINDLETRRTELPGAMATARAERTEVQGLLAAAPAPDENPAMVNARRMRQRARMMRVEAQIAELELEQSSLEKLGALYAARRDGATLERDAAATRVQNVQKLTADQRRQEIDSAERAANTAVAEADPRLRSLAESNVALVEKLRRLAKQRSDLDVTIEAAKRRQESLERDLATSQSREKQIGLTEAIGLELRELRRSQLADLETVRRANRALHADQIAAYTTRYEFENELRRLEDPAGVVDATLGSLKLDVADPTLRGEVRNLLDSRRKLLRKLAEGYSALTRDYGSADAQQQTLLATAERTAKFVDERVLWIPSGQPVWSQPFRTVPDAATRVATLWVDATRSVLHQVVAAPATAIAFALLLVALLGMRPLFLRRLAVHARDARQRAATRFAPTLLAVVDAALLAAPALVLPLALARLSAAAGEAPSVEVALRAIVPLATTLAVVDAALRSDGLALVHFGWEERAVRVVRRDLRIAAPLLVAARAAEATLNAEDDELSATLGRLALLVALFTYLWLFRGILHPTRGALATSPSFATRKKLRVLTYLAGIGVPLGLALLTLLGWVFTASELSVRLERTAVLVLGVSLVVALVQRWLLLSRRAIAIQQARERRRRAAESGAESEALGAETRPEEPEAPVVDLVSLDQQTRSLLGLTTLLALALGAWAIWVDVLPALGILREVSLWTETVQSTVTTTDVAGTHTAVQVTEVPVTLANLLLALVVLGATWVLSRNAGGLFELLVLRHLGVSAGERYAITTVMRYVIVLIGSIIAFTGIGVGWSKLQWMAAAVSVGLGFGLQEIFANFVSGLILLFERPLRVGDLVTVSGVDGRVTRIRMRATTIMDFDRKELIVPNREFITGHFVNWSLSSPVVRLVVKVGVAYGTDTHRARELLLEAARSVRTILPDPTPDAVFRGFGDSTLDLEVRVFHAMDDWSVTITALHEAIDAAFRAEGIEIAFPQRDVHVRSIEGLPGQIPTHHAE